MIPVYSIHASPFRLPCVIILSLHLLLTVVNGAVIDSVPSVCVPACRPIASSLDSCQYLTCLCTEAQGQNMLGCMSCLNGLSTSREIFDAVQVTLQGFTNTCKLLIDLPLNITSTPSPSPSPSVSPSVSLSSSSSPRPSPSSSSTISQPITSSISSTYTQKISSTSATPRPTYSLVAQGLDAQICRLRPAGDRSRTTSSSLAGATTTPTTQPKVLNTMQTVLIIIPVLVFVPLAVIVLRM